MKELLSYIAKHLVDNPDAVSVTEIERGEDVLLELRVAPDDMGKVIGRQGRTSREIRALMKTAGMKENRKVIVEIVD